MINSILNGRVSLKENTQPQHTLLDYAIAGDIGGLRSIVASGDIYKREVTNAFQRALLAGHIAAADYLYDILHDRGWDLVRGNIMVDHTAFREGMYELVEYLADRITDKEFTWIFDPGHVSATDYALSSRYTNLDRWKLLEKLTKGRLKELLREKIYRYVMLDDGHMDEDIIHYVLTNYHSRDI
jgi:hypothetical protein